MFTVYSEIEQLTTTALNETAQVFVVLNFI